MNSVNTAELFSEMKALSSSIGKRTVKERRASLNRFEKSILFHRNEIRAAMSAEFSKAHLDTDYTEIYETLTEIRHARKNLKLWCADQPVSTPLVLLGTRSFIRKESKGVILIISPWNFPFNLSFIPVALAVAAGNCVILKPSENVPEASALMRKIIAESFVDSEVTVVEGGPEVAQSLTALPFDHIMFTGSTQVGRFVMEAAAKNLVPVTLELGGKSPVVIDNTANLKEAARKVVWGRFFNTGQTCVAPDYVLIDKQVGDKFIALLKSEITKAYGDDPKRSADFSRLISKEKAEEKKAMIDEVRLLGFDDFFGGEVDIDEKYCSPTVIVNPNLKARVAQEESFGPILCVFTYDTLDEIVDHINSRPRPLSLYIFSKNKQNIKTILDNTRSGNVAINEVVLQFSNPRLPFGGIGKSGIGRCHGESGFDEFSNSRSILKRSFPISTSLLAFPPYSKLKEKIADFVIRYL